MDFKVDIEVPCKICGKKACRVYKVGNDRIRYKCYSDCGEYTVAEELEPERELVDTKPMKPRNGKDPLILE